MKRLLLFFTVIVSFVTASGQDTVFTMPPNTPNNGQSGVTFELESTQPLNIIGLLNVFSTGATTADIWVRIGGVQHTAGSPPNISTANGWSQVITAAPITGADNSSAVDIPFSGYKLALPANTPVGVHIAGNTRYMTGTAGNANILTDGTLSVKTGDSYGYGGALPNPSFHPRSFVGAVIYELGIVGSCTPFTNYFVDSLTTTTARINWTPGTGNNSFYLEYGQAGFTPGTGTQITGTYPGTQPPVLLTGLSQFTTYDVYIGEICNSGTDSAYFPAPQQFTTEPVCPWPTGLHFLSSTHNTATIGWNNVSGGTWIIEWGPTGFQQGTGSTASTSNNPYTITSNLSPNADFDVYITRDCGMDGLSQITGPITFHTQCAPMTAPYNNSFDTDPLDVPPVCWNAVATGSGSWVEVEDFTGTSSPYSAPRALYMYSSSSSTVPGADTLAAITPRFSDLTASDKRIRFWANSDGPLSRLIVGTLSSLAPNGVFSPIDTISFQLPDTYEEIIVNFDAASGYNGTDEYIVLMHSLGSGFQYVRIDDFNYEPIPACLGSSTSTLSANPSPNDARVFWSGGQGNYTNVYWGTPGFTPGGTGQIGMTTVAGTDTSYLITGLTPQTSYSFYIQDTCTVGGAGVFIGPYNFTTACAAISTPHTESFDVNLIIPPCWSSYSSTGELWRIGTNTYAPSSEHTGNGGYYANVDDSESPSSPDVTLQSPFFDVSNLTNPELYFFVGSQDATVTLSVDVNDGSTWHNDVLVFSAATVNTWDSLTVNLTPFASGGLVAVRFVVDEQNGSFQNDIAIDDVTIRSGPNCTTPSLMTVGGITDSQAILSWFDSPGVSYEVWYGPDGFYQGSQTVGGTKVIVNNDSLVLTGLPENTCFEYGIRKICSAGDTSTWVGPIDFCTLCTNQLTGTYTVGGTPGPNNFPTLDTLVYLLNSCGISGPVTINLNGGIHNSINLYEIIGSSATNTITINGSTAGDSIIGSGGAIQLGGTDYISFNNLYIHSNTGFTVWMHNDAHHISFDNCVIESNRTTTSSLNSVMIASGSSTSQSTSGLNAHHISVTNSTIAGGYYGISIYNLSSASHVNGLTISNCEFEDIYFYGLRSYYNDSVQILNNHFEPFRSTSGYGIYLYYNDIVDVIGNEVEWVGTYALYSSYTNNTGTGTSTIANNLLNGDGTYGVYMYSNNNLDFFHNTINGGTHGMYMSGSTASSYSNLDIRNNIFTANGTGRALWIGTSPLSGLTLNYNLYHNYVGTEIAYQNGVAYTSLSAWQTAEPSYNANSVTGDPVYISPADNLRVLGTVANNVGDNTVGITVDVDGDVRPSAGATTVDIGADEFTPLVGDIKFLTGDFIKGFCLSNNDSIVLSVFNLIGPAIDFSVDPLLVSYSVTGPVNTTGTITINSGTLAPQDTLKIYQNGIDLSVPGTYDLNAHIDSNAVNVLTLNDTLAVGTNIIVHPEFRANPKVTILASVNDSVEVCIESSFFGGGTFFMSEISHYINFGTGAGVKPSYLVADDYIEITGRPGADLDGFTLEQWSGTALLSSHTFGPGTVMGPNGTAIIAIGTLGSSVPSPSNFYYHGNGTYTGGFSSGGSNGRILKDPSGNIIDAVGYNSSYSFPTASGVTTADWSGNTSGTSGSAGIRLIGSDNNMATDWMVVNSSTTQDANVLNANVPIPNPASAPGFTWSYNGNIIDTLPCAVFGPYTAAGTYQYIANYSNSCGTFADTVLVVIPNCSAPFNFSGSAISASSIQLSWDTTGTGATNFDIEYGPVGFNPGTGTIIAATGNSASLSSVPTNLCQEFYVRAACSVIDTSAWIGPITVCPDVSLCDDFEGYNTGGILGQSSLIKGWYASTSGAAAVSTTQSVSGSQSLYIPADGSSDVVAYYDTIDSGTWNFQFNIFVPNGTEAYYNFQRNYTHGDPTQTNVWAFDVNYLASGTASVDGGSYGGAGIASFTYNPGQWNLIEHIIDFDNDSVWIRVNGAATGAGWVYSFNNLAIPVQNNGINFYSNPNLTNPDYYVDDFCIAPYVPSAGCTDPTALNSSNITCEGAIVSWTSGTTLASSVVIYGPAGFNPATGGTVTTATASTLTIPGLTPGTAYDYYVMDICANGDSSALVGPDNFTTLNGPITASFTSSLGAPTQVNLLATFDASASVGATTYDWDFGDGGTASSSSSNTSHSYSLNGTYTVCLTITGACGMDSICDTISVTGISLTENALARSLEIYPNPASSQVRIRFDVQQSGTAVIRLLDLSGKVIMQMEENTIGTEFEQTMDISKLAKGVYMLEVENGDTKAMRRIIKD